jgi:hypothetical protein
MLLKAAMYNRLTNKATKWTNSKNFHSAFGSFDAYKDLTIFLTLSILPYSLMSRWLV